MSCINFISSRTTANRVYAGHLLVVLDGYINNILTFTQRYGEHKKFCKIKIFIRTKALDVLVV